MLTIRSVVGGKKGDSLFHQVFMISFSALDDVSRRYLWHMSDKKDGKNHLPPKLNKDQIFANGGLCKEKHLWCL